LYYRREKIIIQSITLLQYTANIAACKSFSKELEQSWNAIKDLIMAKAIGLHCIIGEISKRKEKYYKIKYNLSKGTHREIKEERKLQETSQYTSSNDIKTKYEKPSNTIQEHQSKCAPITVTKIQDTQAKITCKGITCNRDNQKMVRGPELYSAENTAQH